MSKNMCVHCRVIEARNYGDGKYYCRFCNTRLRRIRRLYDRAGLRLSLRTMHRTYNHWKRTAALDALYLDPIEVKAA